MLYGAAAGEAFSTRTHRRRLTAVVIISMARSLGRAVAAVNAQTRAIGRRGCRLSGRGCALIDVGFGRFGRSSTRRAGPAVSILDTDTDTIGPPPNRAAKVYYGDGTRIDICARQAPNMPAPALVCR